MSGALVPGARGSIRARPRPGARLGPHVLARLAPLLVLASACGARTGLDQPTRDAAVRPRFDAGTFTTFPCRWTLGLAHDVAAGSSWAELSGAVHPTRDEAAVLATDADGRRRGALVSIAAGGGVLAELGPSPELAGAPFTGESDYVLQPPGACGVGARDGTFAPLAAVAWEGTGCTLTQSSIGRVESVSAAGEVRSVAGLGGRLFEAREVATLDGGSGRAFAFHDAASATTLVARALDGRIVLERHLASGATERHEVAGDAATFSAAADPLRGGLILHARDERGWRLDHLDWEAGRWPEPHLELTELPEPAGPIATNETEVLVPLVDGRIAYVPFALVTLMVRFVDPVDGGPIDRMQIVLRPGQSAGGVLYEREGALRFQPLVCNR